MQPSWKHIVVFVAAVVLANMVTIYATAFVFRTNPRLRDHHPGF